MLYNLNKRYSLRQETQRINTVRGRNGILTINNNLRWYSNNLCRIGIRTWYGIEVGLLEGPANLTKGLTNKGLDLERPKFNKCMILGNVGRGLTVCTSQWMPIGPAII